MSTDTVDSDRLKIGVAASPGGHLVEVQQLVAVYSEYNYFYFTFSGPGADDLSQHERVRAIPNVVRTSPFSWISGCWLSLRIALEERPDVVITTGAGVVVFFCFWCKLLGAKIVYIETVAKVETPTVTGRLLHPFADLFFVQWPKLTRSFRKARFLGRLL